MVRGKPADELALGATHVLEARKHHGRHQGAPCVKRLGEPGHGGARLHEAAGAKLRLVARQKPDEGRLGARHPLGCGSARKPGKALAREIGEKGRRAGGVHQGGAGAPGGAGEDAACQHVARCVVHEAAAVTPDLPPLLGPGLHGGHRDAKRKPAHDGKLTLGVERLWERRHEQHRPASRLHRLANTALDLGADDLLACRSQ